MRTIYVILAEKQYSSSKVLAAFDSEDAANKLKETIEAVEPRWTLAVQPIDLQVAPSQPNPIRFDLATSKPDVVWNGHPSTLDHALDGSSVRIYGDGGPVKGEPHAADPPEILIASNPLPPTAI
jgi:hypothetical protein